MNTENKDNFDSLDPSTHILIKGARVNNLKNINVAIPRNKLTVITGVSGSGKSSLAFDTLFAEGQRMYVESLSSYARQFLGRMEKPDVDYIRGVSPAIAVEQKVSVKNARSTVGTTTEIYDYLKLLYARIGTTYSPISGNEVKRHRVENVVEEIKAHEENTKYMIMAPLIVQEGRSLEDELNLLMQKGYSRIYADDQVHYIEEVVKNIKTLSDKVFILIDRGVVRDDEETLFRLNDSVQTAFFEGQGSCIVVIDGKTLEFSDKFELDGILFEEPTVNFFSFNNPYGACRHCDGFGHVLGIDEELVIPDKNLSVYEGAIAPWRSEKMNSWLQPLIKNGIQFDFPIHRPYKELNSDEKKLLWKGNKYFDGINTFFKEVEKQTHKIQYRVLLSRYRGRTVCPECLGTRLRKDASYVKIEGKAIHELVLMSIENLAIFFNNIELSAHDAKVAGRILKEITSRLSFLEKVGLNYLTLNRLTSTLSGGEYQRIKLATSLGSALVGSMYILDEPSIGLHPRDTQQLIEVLHALRDLGNTVVVVEHEEEVMRAADHIIDIGLDAGSRGGTVLFEGNYSLINRDTPSYTAKYLNGEIEIALPEFRRKLNKFVTIKGAREHNLNHVTVNFPLSALSVVTGVSGSGKSTLVKKIINPALTRLIGDYADTTGKYDEVSGSYKDIKAIEFVDQNPIGKSSRSNPVTYIKAYDAIRALYSEQALAKQRAYKPAQFSFNVEGGRCETCQGEGIIKVEMQFMADLTLTCEDCKGKRFKFETLEIEYQGKNIADVLDMTVDDAIEFFEKEHKITDKLIPLQKVGLGYIRLGQSSSSLSGGEAQRVKLASFLTRGNAEQHTLFIFDEPTTGLHFHDINKLMHALQALIHNGHSVMIIEHNMEVIKCADWIIDLGPEGGDKGGNITFEGVPEDMIKLKDNHTAKFLREKLKNSTALKVSL